MRPRKLVEIVQELADRSIQMDIKPGEVYRLVCPKPEPDGNPGFEGYSMMQEAEHKIASKPGTNMVVGKLSLNQEFMIVELLENHNENLFAKIMILSQEYPAIGWISANQKSNWGNINHYRYWVKLSDG